MTRLRTLALAAKMMYLAKNENILEQSDQYCNIVKRLEFEKRADTNVVHVVTILVFVLLRAFVIITRNNT